MYTLSWASLKIRDPQWGIQRLFVVLHSPCKRDDSGSSYFSGTKSRVDPWRRKLPCFPTGTRSVFSFETTGPKQPGIRNSMDVNYEGMQMGV